jgi:hypothetical protein
VSLVRACKPLEGVDARSEGQGAEPKEEENRVLIVGKPPGHREMLMISLLQL